MAARREQAGEPEPDPMASRSRKRAELLTAATGSGKSPRVALEQQVLSQVPPRAVRYRLVLGVEQQFHHAVMAPENSAWNLMPFEAPDDLRLLPGHTYRIVWMDRQGSPVRPLEWAPTPSLHFFLGEPGAEISAQQVESRYQTQTLMQLRQQVHQLERQLAREKRKHQEQKHLMRDWKRRARDEIATLKLRQREDSFESVVGKWAPVVASGLGLYWLSESHGSAQASGTKTGDASESSAVDHSGAELEILPLTERVHSPRNSLVMLSDLVESDDSIPTAQKLARMPTCEVWSTIGSWLEKAKVARPSRSDRSFASSEWRAVQRVSDATSALAFMSQTLQEGESGQSLSVCGRRLLRASERLDEQLHSWFAQQNLAEPLDSTHREELRTFSDDLGTILRESPPQRDDAFGQLVHDALNAIRLRLLGAIGELPGASQSSKKAAPADLRSLALTHGPQVLKRWVNQLLSQRALLRDLLVKEPRHTPPPAESEGEDHAAESQEFKQSHRVATHRSYRDGNPESDFARQTAAPVDAACTEEESPQIRRGSTDVTAPSPSKDEQQSNDTQASSAHDEVSAGQRSSAEPVHRAPAAGEGRPKARRHTTAAQTEIHHEYPASLPDELTRQLATALAENPAWIQTLASALLPGGSTEASRGRKSPWSEVVESLDPTLRAELLDAVRATLQVPKDELG